MRLGFQLLKGVPSLETLDGAHWRARGKSGPLNDPLKSRAGLIWISPVLPMTRQSVNEVTELARPIFHCYGFEYQVTLSIISDRAICAVMSICFDLDNDNECQRARDCHEELMQILISTGYIPYRGTREAQQALHHAQPDSWKIYKKLKSALDPYGVIAPGRYIPQPHPAEILSAGEEFAKASLSRP